jgi:hypothetical protein
MIYSGEPFIFEIFVFDDLCTGILTVRLASSRSWVRIEGRKSVIFWNIILKFALLEKKNQQYSLYSLCQTGDFVSQSAASKTH